MAFRMLSQKSPKYLFNLILSCLSKNPEKRPNFKEIIKNIGYNIKYYFFDNYDNDEDNSFYLQGVDEAEISNYLHIFDEKQEKNDENKLNIDSIIDENKKLKRDLKAITERLDSCCFSLSQENISLRNRIQILESSCRSDSFLTANGSLINNDSYSNVNEPFENTNSSVNISESFEIDDSDSNVNESLENDHSNLNTNETLENINDSNLNENDSLNNNNLSESLNDNDNNENIQTVDLENSSVFNNDINQEEEEFDIKYDSSFPTWKRKVEINRSNNQLFFTCNSMRNELGKVHMIHCDPDETIGTIVRHKKGRSWRFTLLDKSGNLGVNNRQLAGISFFYEQKDAKYRKINLAIPANGQPFISNEIDLSEIAMRGEHYENVNVFTSIIQSDEIGGIKSKKNFRICNENGEPIFTILKKSKNTCQVKFMKPLTPLIAYSISVAISTSHF